MSSKHCVRQVLPHQQGNKLRETKDLPRITELESGKLDFNPVPIQFPNLFSILDHWPPLRECRGKGRGQPSLSRAGGSTAVASGCEERKVYQGQETENLGVSPSPASQQL